MLPALLTLACTPAPTPRMPPPTPPLVETGLPPTDTDPLPQDTGPTPPPPTHVLHGVVPTDPLGLPVFEATAHNGAPRGPEALLGHVTVMWFLPAAATGG